MVAPDRWAASYLGPEVLSLCLRSTYPDHVHRRSHRRVGSFQRPSRLRHLPSVAVQRSRWPGAGSGDLLLSKPKRLTSRAG
jgi:hypothetical protein